MTVFVLDKRKRPLMPCSNKRARLLLERGRAVVHRFKPFTIRLKDRIQGDCVFQPIMLGIDPGSKTTGLALTRRDGEDAVLVFGVELQHRGLAIRAKLLRRSAYRRNRRSRKTRYRPARFKNRTKPKGWLPPSLRHRVESTLTWAGRFRRLAPVTALAYEAVEFDTQRLRNPEVSGIQYQQGTLQGYTVRAYVLQKWDYACAYCGSKDRLTLDHVIPRSRHGSDAVTNLVCACYGCNQRKGNRRVQEFLAKKPTVLKRVLEQLKKPLRDASAVISTRPALHKALGEVGLPLTVGTGAETSYIRHRLKLPKSHVVDAACVALTGTLKGEWFKPLLVVCAGTGRYQRVRTDRFGFPKAHRVRVKRPFGFQTGDLVRYGKVIGRTAVRMTGFFSFQHKHQNFNVKWSKLTLVQRSDGYLYC